jgi:hypothetical protein
VEARRGGVAQGFYKRPTARLRAFVQIVERMVDASADRGGKLEAPW